MAFPTSYTDAELLTYMVSVLGSVAGVLNLDVSDTVLIEAEYDVLFDYGINDAAEANDINKLRTLARYHSWVTVLSEISLDYNFSDAGAKYDRGQMFDHVEKKLAKAKNEALPYLPNYQIESDTIDWQNDPYEFHQPGTYTEVPR